MIGRIVRSADFERVLGTPSRARSAHFAVHHVAASPSQPRRRIARPAPGQPELSTGAAPIPPQPVDESADPGGVTNSVTDSVWTAAPAASSSNTLPDAHASRLDGPLDGRWLGYVVPKRHARRAVTRTLLKRQIRAVFADLPGLPPGLWVVRLRMPFDRKQFPSASSEALREAARAELLHLVRKLAPAPATGS